jgi:hypothetical protein
VEAGNLAIPLYRFGFGAITLSSPLSDWEIDSAAFEVHTVDAGSPATTFAVHEMLVNWDEATVTWGRFGGSGPQSGTHYKAASEGSVTLGGGAASDTIDLTAMAEFWIDNPDQNYGVILIPAVQSGTLKLGIVFSERLPGLDSDDTRLLVSASTVGVTPGSGIEQVEDLYVHTASGTHDGDAGGFVLQGGVGFAGGDGAFLMKWDEGDADFSGHVRSELDVRRLSGDQDGSFSVHQMITAWSESTDFGTTLPMAGVDYSPNPIASIGFNNDDGPSAPFEDVADVSALVNYWIANPTQNQGVIFVPRGPLNGAYPGSFGNAVNVPSQERINPGLDVDDTRIVPFKTGSGPAFGVLEAIDDTTIHEAIPNTLSFKVRTDGNPASSPGAGVDAGNLKIPLYRFGFGAITLSAPLSDWDVDFAGFEVHTVQAGNASTTFSVHEMLVEWDEATVTWGRFGGSGPQSGTHYQAAAEGTVTLGGGAASDTVDLTALADFWIDHPDRNYGVILIPAVQTGTLELGIVMSERLAGLDSDDTRMIVSAAPKIVAPTLTPVIIEDVMVLEFNSNAGFDYGLESNTAFPGAAFTPNGMAIQGTGGTMYLYDTNTVPDFKPYRVGAAEE